MTESTYAVGRGKPPLHTRFQKGQSGNPCGKPGPAKLAKERFARALLEALDGDPNDIERKAPETGIALMARRLAQAIGGRTAAQRLVLSLLDKEHAKQVEAERPSLEEMLWPDPEHRAEIFGWSPPAERNERETNSLTKGKTQGKRKFPAEEFFPLPPDTKRARSESFAPAKPDPLSLLQGKKQGSEKFPGARAQLLAGAAMLGSTRTMGFGTPPPR